MRVYARAVPTCHPERRHQAKGLCSPCYNRQPAHQAKVREWAAGHPGYPRERWLQANYGLSVADYETLLSYQDGGCAICGKEAAAQKALDVDHDHGTGEWRGILCNNCNRAIGHLKHDPRLLIKAAAYLEKFQMNLRIFADIDTERGRQQALKKAGKLPWTCADQKPSDGNKLAVLAKQVGDTATVVVSVLARPEGDLRKELVQVAAVAVAWIESIDRAAETQLEAAGDKAAGD